MLWKPQCVFHFLIQTWLKKIKHKESKNGDMYIYTHSLICVYIHIHIYIKFPKETNNIIFETNK